MPIFVLLAVLAGPVTGCSGDTGLTSRPVGAPPDVNGGGEESDGPAAPPVDEPDSGEEGEGETGPSEPDSPAGEGEGEAAPAIDPPGEGACVQREREEAEFCWAPCSPTCDGDGVCLTFPEGALCLSSGERTDGRTCTSPGDCEGGLCIWSGGGPAHCSRECPAQGAGADAVCGDGRTCLPSTTPAGSFHCYATGALPIGDPCLRREGECEGGYCLGAGQAAYCTAWCDPAAPAETCLAGWTCRAYGDAHLCCDPQRTQGGC